MSDSLTRVALPALCLLTMLSASPCHAQAPSHAAPTPVIVELFTSEGCSDCPPADLVLAKLAEQSPVAGTQVIALGEHVDYWDHGGWADPFSSKLLTNRQSDYATIFHSAEVYTPQMVVDGVTQFVGSDSDMAAHAILSESRRPKTPIVISAVHLEPSAVSFQVAVGALPGGQDTEADVYVAITEDGLSSHVRGGENGGRTLRHVAVVRQMRAIGTSGRDGGTLSARLPLIGGWQRNNLNLVSFVQVRGSGRIIGAVRYRLLTTQPVDPYRPARPEGAAITPQPSSL